MNGHGTQIPSQTVYYGEKAVRPRTPMDPDWEFVNYFADEAMTTVFDFDTVVLEDTVIYLQWVETEEPNAPQTGDFVILMTSLVLLSGAVLTGSFLVGKRKKDEI